MTKIKIQQLNIHNHLSVTEQKQTYGGNVAESILSQYSAGGSSISGADNIFKFTDNNGNASGAIVSNSSSSFYVKDGIIEKVDNGEVTDSLNLNSAFLL
ncbi:MAG: hypothetical protein AAF383_20490 [Cyanobacteria bacterium P01_A01_bin.83]